jgi:NADH-quinone oxidoreductase subunit J
MDAIAFYVSGLVSLIASLLVVTRRNPVHGAVFLVLFFATVSLDFLILRAPFLAVIQVLVYAGAIMVLYLFVIMLLSLKPEELKEEVKPGRRALAAVFSGGLFFLLAYAIRQSPRVAAAPDLTAPLDAAAAAPVRAAAAGVGTTEAIGLELFRSQILHFEVVSVLILIAIIGAIHLTRKRQTAPEAAAPLRQAAMVAEGGLRPEPRLVPGGAGRPAGEPVRPAEQAVR